MSQDLLQQAMDRILARAPGCVGIADDVVVYGRDNTEHDKNLLRLMQVAKEEGLVFNSKKFVIKTSEIVFFGSVYGKDGIKPDPSKIEDTRKMPTPQDRGDLQRFIGLMNYLAAYIPHFADKVSPLRELLKKDVPVVWHEDHQRTYDDLMRCIGSESCMSHYHPQKETVLEVDASQKGLGACLLQDNKPVAFASKTLTPTQSAYSNIKRETLAIVNGVTKFHTYLFGKPFVIITFAHDTQQSAEERTSTSTTTPGQDTTSIQKQCLSKPYLTTFSAGSRLRGARGIYIIRGAPSPRTCNICHFNGCNRNSGGRNIN